MKAPILFTWLDTSPTHERARNRTTIKADSGEVVKDERYGAKAVGGRALAAIYPLHIMGTTVPCYIAVCAVVVNAVVSFVLSLFLNAVASDKHQDLTVAADYN